MRHQTQHRGNHAGPNSQDSGDRRAGTCHGTHSDGRQSRMWVVVSGVVSESVAARLAADDGHWHCATTGESSCRRKSGSNLPLSSARCGLKFHYERRIFAPFRGDRLGVVARGLGGVSTDAGNHAADHDASGHYPAYDYAAEVDPAGSHATHEDASGSAPTTTPPGRTPPTTTPRPTPPATKPPATQPLGQNPGTGQNPTGQNPGIGGAGQNPGALSAQSAVADGRFCPFGTHHGPLFQYNDVRKDLNLTDEQLNSAKLRPMNSQFATELGKLAETDRDARINAARNRCRSDGTAASTESRACQARRYRQLDVRIAVGATLVDPERRRGSTRPPSRSSGSTSFRRCWKLWRHPPDGSDQP